MLALQEARKMAKEETKDFNAMLHRDTDMPKIQIITDPAVIQKYGGEKMYFAPPLVYDEIMRSVPRGKLLTVGHIRAHLARKNGADFTDTITAGIFVSMAAWASHQRQENKTPYWRALKAGGDEALDKLDEAMEVYGRVFDENCTYKVVPYKGIERMLETLKKQGIRLAVLSNKPDRQVGHVIKEIFGEGLFDWIQGQKEGVPRKPDPSAALDIADRLGAEIAETAYIGDSEVDLATGKAAGMKTILVSWGFRGRKALEEDGADCIVDSVDEILEIMR